MTRSQIVVNPKQYQDWDKPTSKWFVLVGVFAMGFFAGAALMIWLMSK